MSDVPNELLFSDTDPITNLHTSDTIVVPMDENIQFNLNSNDFDVRLLPPERKFFEEFISRERSSCRNFKIAKAMLLLDKNQAINSTYTSKEITDKSGFCERTLCKLKKTFIFMVLMEFLE